jgi:hypothetical protein
MLTLNILLELMFGGIGKTYMENPKKGIGRISLRMIGVVLTNLIRKIGGVRIVARKSHYMFLHSLIGIQILGGVNDGMGYPL